MICFLNLKFIGLISFKLFISSKIRYSWSEITNVAAHFQIHRSYKLHFKPAFCICPQRMTCKFGLLVPHKFKTNPPHKVFNRVLHLAMQQRFLELGVDVELLTLSLVPFFIRDHNILLYCVLCSYKLLVGIQRFHNWIKYLEYSNINKPLHWKYSFQISFIWCHQDMELKSLS